MSGKNSSSCLGYSLQKSYGKQAFTLCTIFMQTSPVLLFNAFIFKYNHFNFCLPPSERVFGGNNTDCVQNAWATPRIFEWGTNRRQVSNLQYRNNRKTPDLGHFILKSGRGRPLLNFSLWGRVPSVPPLSTPMSER